MTKINLLFITVLLILVVVPVKIHAQDTFSIVAVDTLTGEIGSAGASCVGPIGGIGAFILSDVIEGIGGIHTQASWNSTNQQNAHNRMLEGLSPQEIIDWLVANDAQGNPTIRQYGIVDLTRNGESAAYTGVNCSDYKNHATGPGYSIQGNILLGQIIIDTMKTVFLQTSGEPLADRLMKTLEAAKIIGADTRCAVRNTSSQSGFVKVVRIGDGSNPYLKIVVPDTPSGTDPIDVLRGQFNDWKIAHLNIVDPFLSELSVENDTLPANGTSQTVVTIIPKNNSDTLLASGLEIILSNSGGGTLGTVTDLGNGIYQASLTSSPVIGVDTISAITISASDTVSIFNKAVVFYTTPVSAEADKFPDSYYLFDNFPNPFNPTTSIKFIIGEKSFVVLKVYDVLGNEITTLVNEEKSPGTYEVKFEAANLQSGVYFYQMNAQKFIKTRKMILLK